jgi:uncharacterized protein
MNPFAPRPYLRSGHVMTLYCWGARRRFPRLPPPEERLFRVTPDTHVLAHCYWQADRHRPTLLALHGLESSSRVHYMQGMADKAYRAGFNAILLNQRNCGDTEHLGPGLYNSGLTHDADVVIRELTAREGVPAIAVAYCDAPPPALKAVCAVSPVMELATCVRALERKSNVVYQWNFVRGLKARMRRKDRHWPGRFGLDALDRIRTVRQFDEAYTAPHFGYAGAEDYYHRAAAMRVIDRIRVPALIITAKDDPFVPFEPFLDPKVTGNPNVRVVITDHGGHCGFLGRATGGGDDGYWAERAIVEFVSRAFRSAPARTPVPSPAPRA